MGEKERFIQLRAEGKSFDKISKELGKAKQTLVSWGKDLREEISARKALELDALYEKHMISIQGRIETYGSIMEKIKKEITKRDFKDVPTEKLLELMLKYQAQIKQEVIAPVFSTDEEVQVEKEHREAIESLIGLKN